MKKPQTEGTSLEFLKQQNLMQEIKEHPERFPKNTPEELEAWNQKWKRKGEPFRSEKEGKIISPEDKEP